MYQWDKNYCIYCRIIIFRDNHFTCTALHDGLHKSNYFIYFAIMNILCFHLKTQFEKKIGIFFGDLKYIHNIGFESTSIDICWHSCSQTQRNTSSTIPTWEKYSITDSSSCYSIIKRSYIVFQRSYLLLLIRIHRKRWLWNHSWMTVLNTSVAIPIMV